MKTTFAVLAFCSLVTPAAAEKIMNLPVYHFDSDGGVCDFEDDLMPYVEIGVESLLYIQGGNKYIGEGGYIVDFKRLGNGLEHYLVVPYENESVRVAYTVDPKRATVASFLTDDPKVLQREGNVDVMNLEHCDG